MRVVVVTPPLPIVTVDEADAALRADGDNPALIAGMVAAAQGHIDGPAGWLGRAIGMQTLEARFDGFDAGGMLLRCPPIASIVSVKYLDDSGVAQTMAPGSYELIDETLFSAWGTSWPSSRQQPAAVRVRYQAGYADPPAPVRQAVLLMVGDLYRNRDTVVVGAATAIPMSTTVEAMLGLYRVFR